MDSIKYRIISIGGEKKEKYAIYQNFGAVPLGRGYVLVCNLNNRHKVPIKWISYEIIFKTPKKVFKNKFLHFFKKAVVLDGFLLSPKNKKQKLFRYQSINSIFKLPYVSQQLAIQFTA